MELKEKINNAIEKFMYLKEYEPTHKEKCNIIIDTYREVLRMIEHEKIKEFGKKFNKKEESIFKFLGVKEI